MRRTWGFVLELFDNKKAWPKFELPWPEIHWTMGSEYGVPDADNLDRRITKYKWWLIPIQVRKVSKKGTSK